jgi:hypothetical protein
MSNLKDVLPICQVACFGSCDSLIQATVAEFACLMHSLSQLEIYNS